jgi:hypothetical protein
MFVQQQLPKMMMLLPLLSLLTSAAAGYQVVDFNGVDVRRDPLCFTSGLCLESQHLVPML